MVESRSWSRFTNVGTEESNVKALDDLDRAILNRIQIEVPLAKRPFRVLAREFGVGEDEMIERVRNMWDMGIVRRLGPILNYRAWGMSGVLVAAKVGKEHVEKARAAIEDYPEITHAYLRDYAWNLWFTVIAEDEEKMDQIIDRLEEQAGLKDIRKLPQEKSFKLGVRFHI
jgi:DNA-binding Lrp family transcriptional regulator